MHRCVEAKRERACGGLCILCNVTRKVTMQRHSLNTNHRHPNAISSTIINANPIATPTVPIFVCSPDCASGISSSTTT